MDLYEYQKELGLEAKARGTIRKTCVSHLQELIKETMSVPQIKESLKEKTSIINGPAIKMYRGSLGNQRIISREGSSVHSVL